MPDYTARDISESKEFRLLFEGLEETPYKPTAWGYVYLLNEDYHSVNIEGLLVGERCKKDDPKREGQFVIPGGGVNAGETFIGAAKREVLEETRVKTIYNTMVYPKGDFYSALLKSGKNVLGLMDKKGRVWIQYKDSGKRYAGRMAALQPVKNSYPKEQESSDVRHPRFMCVQEAIDRKSEFTPACQILLEIILLYEFSYSLDDDYFIQINGNIGKYLKFPAPVK